MRECVARRRRMTALLEPIVVVDEVEVTLATVGEQGENSRVPRESGHQCL
jgi:hypothetical protein